MGKTVKIEGVIGGFGFRQFRGNFGTEAMYLDNIRQNLRYDQCRSENALNVKGNRRF
jgi:hypothetical protein